MIKPLRKMFKKRSRRPCAAAPTGERYYVIGDIHGRLDLFDELICAVEQDDLAAPKADTTIILLGDLVDRGMNSAGVIKRARTLQAQRKVRILAGNHEEMFLESLTDTDVLRHFLKHGGRETILSYGLEKRVFNKATLEELQQLMKEIVPQGDIDFIRSFEEMIVAGDYIFAHAGINPHVPLDQQKRHDLLWIREPFLRHSDDHPGLVVHGHTIVEQVEERKNRIAIDTGAFRTGRLTALVLEGGTRRYIQTEIVDDAIMSNHSDSLDLVR